MAATPIPPWRPRRRRGRVNFSPPEPRYPPALPFRRTNSLSRGGEGRRRMHAEPRRFFHRRRRGYPTPMAAASAASAVVMAQNRFSIFCRRKTTDGGRGIVPKTALATSAQVAERRGETGRSLCCHRKREAVFWRHLGVMMGNIPYYGKQIARTFLCGRSLGRNGLSFSVRA